LCGAFLHDVDLAIEFQKRGHSIMFLTIEKPKEGYEGGTWRGFRFMHYSAAGPILELSQLWVCPHAPCLPYVRKLNGRGYNRPIAVTAHFDGHYEVLTMLASNKWVEMLMFINRTMEGHFRANVVPFPSSIIRTSVVRPLMQESKVRMDVQPQGEYITLVNANVNKGVHQFIEIAKRLPSRKFLAVRPYYGELWVPPSPSNIEWVPFDDDIRTILKRTRILVMPSYYESFGRIAVEAMYNGIPVLYSKPLPNPKQPSGTTEGLHAWISPAGVSCERENIDEWMSAITTLDDQDVYTARSLMSREHITKMNLFTEGARIAGLVEQFVRDNPVKIQTPQSKQEELSQQTPQQTATKIVQPVGRVGFSSGRLRIQR
jgi:hypothetical protein